jgi:hypothetical protein
MDIEWKRVLLGKLNLFAKRRELELFVFSVSYEFRSKVKANFTDTNYPINVFFNNILRIHTSGLYLRMLAVL